MLTKISSFLLILMLLLSYGCSFGSAGAETAINDESGSLTSIIFTTRASTTSVTAVKILSPAWLEAEQLEDSMSSIDASTSEGFKQHWLGNLRSLTNYVLSNPNKLSTPVGALCWVYHELTRAGYMSFSRGFLDEEYNKITDQLGLVNENSDKELADVLLGFLTANSDTTIATDVIVNEDTIVPTSTTLTQTTLESIETSELEEALAFYRTPEMIEWIRISNEGAGDGTEWMTAVRAVSAPEIEAATKRGDGLPKGAQKFANALFNSVDEYLGSGKTDPMDFRGLGFFDNYRLSGYNDFIEIVKYDQNCQRLSAGLSWGNGTW